MLVLPSERLHVRKGRPFEHGTYDWVNQSQRELNTDLAHGTLSFNLERSSVPSCQGRVHPDDNCTPVGSATFLELVSIVQFAYDVNVGSFNYIQCPGLRRVDRNRQLHDVSCFNVDPYRQQLVCCVVPLSERWHVPLHSSGHLGGCGPDGFDCRDEHEERRRGYCQAITSDKDLTTGCACRRTLIRLLVVVLEREPAAIIVLKLKIISLNRAASRIDLASRQVSGLGREKAVNCMKEVALHEHPRATRDHKHIVHTDGISSI
jgi:hypothetical protein